MNDSTYLLPIDRLFGLILVCLNLANTSSQGATLYEYGPRNINGTFSSYRYSRVYLELWYGALSINMTWLSLHYGLIRSNVVHSSLKKRPIVIELEFDCDSERKTWPKVSIATIIDIFGATFLTARLLRYPLYAQFIL